MAKIIKTTKTAIKQLSEQYLLSVTEEDMHRVRGIIYLSTSKTAELLGVRHHTFCNTYVTPLVNSGVRRLVRGRQKYYCLSEVLVRLDKSIEKAVTVLKICRLMALE